jgi:polyisoprenoid-binding protein YceI
MAETTESEEQMSQSQDPAPEEATAPTEEPVAEAPATAEAAAPTEEAAPEEPAAESADIRTYVIVSEESQASYTVDEEFFGGALDRLGIEPGLVDTVGTTQEVSGQMELDFSNPASPLVSNQFEVNIRSLTSDQSRRDNAIRDRFLESDTYPLAQFTITSLENLPESYTEGEEISFQATGDMTIREITQPTTFDVTAVLQGDTITGSARTPLTMTDFGFAPPSFANLFDVANDFTVNVDFTFREQ